MDHADSTLWARIVCCSFRAACDIVQMIHRVFARKPGVESTMPANSASNCFIIENILPKGVILSYFICTLALSDEYLLDLYLQY